MKEHPIVDVACDAVDVSTAPARFKDGGMDRIRRCVADSIEEGTVLECARSLVQFAKFVDAELKAHELAGEILTIASVMNAALDEALRVRTSAKNEALARRAAGFTSLFGAQTRPVYQPRKTGKGGVNGASFLAAHRRILPR